MKKAFSKEYQCDIIGTTHLYIKFDIFRTKNCCPYYNSLLECVQIGTTFFIYFPVLLLYDAFAMGICAALSIFSIKIPYPSVGSATITCVTAPISLPSCMIGEPLIPRTMPPVMAMSAGSVTSTVNDLVPSL